MHFFTFAGLLVVGLIFLAMGMIQGLGLAGLGDEPLVQGYIGGLAPVACGVMATLCIHLSIRSAKSL